jgi:hypothetical protein
MRDKPIAAGEARRQNELFPLSDWKCWTCRQQRWLEIYPRTITDLDVWKLPLELVQVLCHECADKGGI